MLSWADVSSPCVQTDPLSPVLSSHRPTQSSVKSDVFSPCVDTDPLSHPLFSLSALVKHRSGQTGIYEWTHLKANAWLHLQLCVCVCVCLWLWLCGCVYICVSVCAFVCVSMHVWVSKKWSNRRSSAPAGLLAAAQCVALRIPMCFNDKIAYFPCPMPKLSFPLQCIIGTVSFPFANICTFFISPYKLDVKWWLIAFAGGDQLQYLDHILVH